jgi:hypothetical protein
MRAKTSAIAAGILVAGAACSQSGTEVRTAYSGTLTSEVIDTADVTLLVTADGASFDATLAMSSGYGFLDDASILAMSGRIDAYPESDLIVYAATKTVPAHAGGPCGDSPVSLALSLVRRGGNVHAGGGLAAYCGSATYAGAPQRIMRLQGDLPPG